MTWLWGMNVCLHKYSDLGLVNYLLGKTSTYSTLWQSSYSPGLYVCVCTLRQKWSRVKKCIQKSVKTFFKSIKRCQNWKPIVLKVSSRLQKQLDQWYFHKHQQSDPQWCTGGTPQVEKGWRFESLTAVSMVTMAPCWHWSDKSKTLQWAHQVVCAHLDFYVSFNTN